MQRLTLLSCSSAEGRGECRLSPLRHKQGPQLLSKLEMLQREYQERALQEKEQKMLNLLTQQQERISRRITGALQPPEDKAWASNWTVAKRTAGVDRAHLLQPLYPHRQPKLQRSPSASDASIKPSLPYVRSKSGPTRSEQWQQLEKSEMNLEAEIRRKEAVLREKLRRTEEELRRMQKEKEHSEWEERRTRDIHDTKTRPRRTRLEEADSKGRKTATKHNSAILHQYSQGRMKAGKHSPLSVDQYGGCREPATDDRPQALVQTQQQYGGDRRRTVVTQVADTFHQLRLEAPGVPDVGHPSSDHLDEETLLHGNIPHSPTQPLVQCQLCGRHFMAHRLEKHVAICKKTYNSRRKLFDSSKARAKGTDLEPYLHKKGSQSFPVIQARVNSWRQKHESFLRTIRHAREVQDVIARGGRISDLPPPPPEENPDYVPCPHCSRRFAPRAAERHIPKCETIRSKPRPPPSNRRR